jgi:hypothetical protein
MYERIENTNVLQLKSSYHIQELNKDILCRGKEISGTHNVKTVSSLLTCWKLWK